MFSFAKDWKISLRMNPGSNTDCFFYLFANLIFNICKALPKMDQ